MVSPNLRNAALVMRCLPPSAAHLLHQRLTPAEAQRLATAVQQLGEISARDELAAIEAFCRTAPPAGEQPRADFAFLAETSTSALAQLLAGEHPQTRALVLAALPSRAVAEYLQLLPAEEQRDLLERLAGGERAAPEIVATVALGLAQRLRAPQSPAATPTVPAEGGPLDAATRQLAGMANHTAELIDEIRRRLAPPHGHLAGDVRIAPAISPQPAPAVGT